MRQPIASAAKIGQRTLPNITASAQPRADSPVDFPMTIRLRLTLWYTALLGATLILFSFIFYSALAANLWGQAQQDAARQATQVSNALTQQLEGNILIIRNNPTRIQFPDLDFFSSSVGVQVIELDGRIVKRSSNLGSVTIKGYASGLDTIRTGHTHRFYTTNDNDMPLLVYSVPILANSTIIGAVQVIKPIGEVQNTLSQVSRFLIIGTALSLALAAIGGAFLARGALAPIDTITHTAGAISRTKDLSRRLTISHNAGEVGQLAATFNEMLDRIQQLFKSQERLIADVSHELRTPLTTVQGNIELLRRTMAATAAATETDPERARRVADIWQETISEVENETTRMNKMISDLLLLAQADSGDLQLQLEPVEMDTLLLDIYLQIRRIADRTKGQNALEIRLGHEDQAIVRGDRERLRQLLLNLADNAVKYTPAGGVITLSLENSGGWVKISVSDTGIGISPEDQAHVFDRFYRTDKARSRELGGSGLGLSIVQWITRAHNGTITVESILGQGTTFTLRLPALASPALAELEHPSPHSTPQTPEAAHLPG